MRPVTEAEPVPASASGGRLTRRLPRLPRPSWLGRARAHAAHQVTLAATLLVIVVLALMVVRLPWAGDLGIHAATIERLRHNLGAPGDPLVDAKVNSPYYSPWMVLLALLCDATGLGTFPMLHIAAGIALVALLTGLAHLVRTFTTRRTAVPLAILCVTLLSGWSLFTWSGFPGLTSLSLCLAYPSTLALGVAFHLWALARKALARDWGITRYLLLGAILGLQLLIHQFTGVVTVLGLAAVVFGARQWPRRVVWGRIAAALAVTVVVLLAWPYYSFLSLPSAGDLDQTHESLYTHLTSRFCLVALGAAALAVRFRRDRRDPLVLLFALGSVVYAAGWVTGHYSLGRVLPAVLISAQIALALEAAGAGRLATRRVFAPLTAVGLLVGVWAQIGTLTFVLQPSALPPVVRAAPSESLWSDFSWIRPYVHYGDTIMTEDYYALRQAPAYGVYTVAPGYPDFFLHDEEQRKSDTTRFYAPHTTRAQRLRLLKKYHAKWVLTADADGQLVLRNAALKPVATEPTPPESAVGATPPAG